MFDYDGPLTTSDLNCHIDMFPFATSVTFSAPHDGKHDITGIQWNDGTPRVPIFVPFKDRLGVLLESLRSFHRHIRTPFVVVILNDNTTYPPAVGLLKRLSQGGVQVHHVQWSRKAEEFDNLFAAWSTFIHQYMAHSSSETFVLSDPDCALDSAPGDILSVYRAAMSKLNLKIVGAAIRWDDFPRTADLTAYGIGGGEAFDRRDPKYLELDGKYYYFIDAHVDSTFAMYNKSLPMKRMDRPVIRMLPPLAVRHLDWYLNSARPPADYHHYIARVKDNRVNHMFHVAAKQSVP
jgi:hypothetical protein